MEHRVLLSALCSLLSALCALRSAGLLLMRLLDALRCLANAVFVLHEVETHVAVALFAARRNRLHKKRNSHVKTHLSACIRQRVPSLSFLLNVRTFSAKTQAAPYQITQIISSPPLFEVDVSFLPPRTF